MTTARLKWVAQTWLANVAGFGLGAFIAVALFGGQITQPFAIGALIGWVLLAAILFVVSCALFPNGEPDRG